MPYSFDISKRLKEIAGREWDAAQIKARFGNLVRNGIPQKTLDRQNLLREKDKIIERVQRRAEEYCYLTGNCAKGSATSLFEEFGLGNMEIIRGLAPFPGIAMSGGICGPVAGGLMMLGLFFPHKDVTNNDAARAYIYSRIFIKKFTAVFGSLYCPDIQKKLLGKYFDPMASMENMKAFNSSSARTNCTVAPGIGAGIAAEVIIESMKE
ncbi:MAG TPA: C-GCAxxG-C-C family protein [Smithellaceae bacterium]|nr:C-GCAxxG-C-C family protein [Smithellaceae bacterium]HRS88140.1 C-GCAxxG-C-C family protein [Smithellaceae bacterium]HRV25386.1 C-GCAxxG-C-C family protein [Smithellaceae bacterium]